MGKLSVINKRFIEAAKINQIDELKNLLSQGADIRTDDYALINSAFNGHLKTVKYLLTQSADIHAGDDYALRLSARYGYLEIVKLLVTEGANIHANDNCALRWSAQYGHLEIVKFLATQGANIHTNNDEALRLAASCGHLEIVKFLVTQGANIHANNDYALRRSAKNGQLEVVKFLLTQGAYIHTNNDEALKDSARSGYHDVWQVLSAFIQEEKLLVAASDAMIITAQGLLSVDESLVPALGSVAMVAAVGVTSASTWVCGMPLVAASDSMLQTQPQTITKAKRSKI